MIYVIALQNDICNVADDLRENVGWLISHPVDTLNFTRLSTHELFLTIRRTAAV